MTLEMGKPIAAAEAEVEKCAWACEYYAEHGPRHLAPEPVATDAAKSLVRYEPLGVVLAVMPWNFPFWQLFRCAVHVDVESCSCRTRRSLNCCEIHPVSRACAEQSGSANMHFTNCRRHLLNGADFFDDETMRQKSLVDQLNDGFIPRFEPDGPKMFTAYLHTLCYDI